MLTCKNHTPGWRLHKVFHCPFKVINYSETFIVFLRRVHNDSPERAFNLKVAPLRTPLQTWQPQYDSHCSEEYKNHYKPLSFTIVHYYFLHPHPIHTGWNEARLWWEIISSTLKGARFGKLNGVLQGWNPQWWLSKHLWRNIINSNRRLNLLCWACAHHDYKRQWPLCDV